MHNGNGNHHDDDHIDQYEEDNQYMGNGENGTGVTEKYVESRVARKKVEEDVKLLQNRIMLLKLEEKKVSTFQPV